MAGIAVPVDYEKAQAHLANSMISIMKANAANVDLREFIPNVEPCGESSADSPGIDFESDKPVLGVFLPADALPLGECLAAKIANPSEDLCFVRQFFLFLSFLPDTMRQNLTLMSVAMYVMRPDCTHDGEEAPPELSPDSASLGRAEDAVGDDLFVTVFPEHETHPNRQRRFLGTIFLVQERPGHTTSVDKRVFPLSNCNELKATGARTSASESSGWRRGGADHPDDDESVSSSQRTTPDAEAPRAKKTAAIHHYDISLLDAMREVGLVWSKLAANEKGCDVRGGLHGNSTLAALSKRLTDTVAGGQLGGINIAQYDYTTLRAAAQACVPPLFDVDPSAYRVNAQGFPVRSSEYADAVRRAERLDSDISVMYDVELLWKVVKQRAGVAADVFPRCNDNKLVQGEYTSVALETEEGDFRCPAFGGTAWLWTLTSGAMPFTGIFFTRVPGMHYIPPISPAVAQRYLTDRCATRFPRVVAHMEGLSEADRINFVYFSLFGGAFGNTGGDENFDLYRLNPRFSIITGFGGLAGQGSENFMEEVGAWLAKSNLAFSFDSIGATVQAILALLTQFETRGGGRKGVAFMCNYPRHKTPDLKRFVARGTVTEDAFAHIMFRHMRDNGLMHEVTYRAMLAFVAYAASGYAGITHPMFQGTHGSGKSMIVSIIRTLCGGGGSCISEFTLPVLRNMAALESWGFMIIPEELPEFLRAAVGTSYTVSPAKTALNGWLEGKAGATMARVQNRPGEGYRQAFTSQGKAHVVICIATNDPKDAIDKSSTDRFIVEYFVVHMRPCQTIRKLNQSSSVLDEKNGVDSTTAAALTYLAQAARLKGFCESLLGFPKPLMVFLSPKNLESIDKLLLIEGGAAHKARTDGTLTEATCVYSFYEALVCSLSMDAGALRQKKDHVYLSTLVALASRFHIPTGVTYLQAVSYMRDECEMCTQRLLLALIIPRLRDHPEILVAAWGQHTLKIPYDVFDLGNTAGLCEMFKRENYMEIGDTTVASLVGEIRRDTRTDEAKKALFKFGKDHTEISLSYLRRCFTQKQQDVLAEVCMVSFKAPLADTLMAIATTLRVISERALACNPMPRSMFSSEGSANEDSNQFGFDCDQPLRPVRSDSLSSQQRDSPSTADVISQQQSDVGKILKGTEFEGDQVAMREHLCRGLALLKEFVECYSEMRAGGVPLIRLQRKPYWDVSVRHLATEPTGMFNECTLTFTASQLHAMNSEIGESMGVVNLQAVLHTFPFLRHTTAAALDEERCAGEQGDGTRHAADAQTQVYVLRLSEYKFFAQVDADADASLFRFGECVGRMQLRIMMEKDAFHFYNKLTLEKEAGTLSFGVVAISGRALVARDEFRDAILSIPNMTREGPLDRSQLAGYAWVRISDDGTHLSAGVEDVRLAVHGSDGGETFLGNLFMESAFRVAQRENMDVLQTLLGDVSIHVLRTAYDVKAGIKRSQRTVAEYLQKDDHLEFIKQLPCVEFKPGFVQPLHERFRCVYDALMKHGKGVVHGETLLRTIRQNRHQTDIDSVEELDNVLRVDECVSRYRTRVLHAADPKPSGLLRGVRRADIADTIARSAQRQAQERQAAAAAQEARILADASAIMQSEAREHGPGESPPGSPGPALSPSAAPPPQPEDPAEEEPEVTVHNYLTLPSHAFSPRTQTYTFGTAYVRDLFDRLLPPTGRALKHLAGFSPFFATIKTPLSAPPDKMPTNIARMPFTQTALRFVTLGHESMFHPGEPLRLPYSPYTGSVLAIGPTKDEGLDADMEIYKYQSQFSAFRQHR
jgi:hypothetical protein